MTLDICLVNMPSKFFSAGFPNIGLANLSTSLKMAGYDVVVVHPPYQEKTIDDITEEITSLKAPMVGFSLFYDNYAASRAIAEKLKQKDNPPTILFGGNLASCAFDRIMQDTEAVDFLFRGHADKSLVEFMERRKKGGDVKTVDGLVYKGDNGLVVNKKSLVKPSEIPTGDPFYIIQILSQSKFQVIPIDIARGDCKGRCIFCASEHLRTEYTEKGVNRYRDIKRVMAEINFWASKGHQRFYLNTEDMLANPSYFSQLIDYLNMLNKEIFLKLEIRPPSLVKHKDIIEKMFSSGRISSEIELGVQSMSAEALKLLRTGSTVEINREAIEFLRQYNPQCLTVVDYILFPHPDLSPEAQDENTYHFARLFFSKDLQVGSPLRFEAFPGTHLFNMLVERDFKPDRDNGFAIDYKFTDPLVQKAYEESKKVHEKNE